MIEVPRWCTIVLSTLSGIVVGVTAGFYGPFLLAAMQDQNPFHVGSYGDWIISLMIALPVIGGASLAVLAWRNRWPIGLRVLRWLALVIICWQLFLIIT